MKQKQRALDALFKCALKKEDQLNTVIEKGILECVFT